MPNPTKLSGPSNRFISRDQKKKKDNPLDFYETPAVAVEELLKREKFDGSIWEPCAGKGAIAKVLKAHGYRVYTSDIQLYEGFDLHFTSDFLSPEERNVCSNIVTNPPFNRAEECVRQALKKAKKKVAMLLRIQFLEGQARYQMFVEDGLAPTRIWIFSKRISCDKEGTSMYCYAWFVWDIPQYDEDWSDGFPPTTIGWILH